jgi:hypothetical protein
MAAAAQGLEEENGPSDRNCFENEINLITSLVS